MQLRSAPLLGVMAGLVPAIHAAPLQTALKVFDGCAAWMPGTRPGMTCRVQETEHCNRILFPGQPLDPRQSADPLSEKVDQQTDARNPSALRHDEHAQRDGG
jgi:hypothetical protein